MRLAPSAEQSIKFPSLTERRILRFDTPLVSVVIVNYNGKSFVEKCVKSVLDSDFPLLETIVIDNASTDGSTQALERLGEKDGRLIVIKNRINYGFAVANNIGVGLSKGDLILFLNPDTTVEPGCISELVNVICPDRWIGAAQCKILTMDDPSLIDSAGHFIDVFGVSFLIGSLEKDRGQYDRVADIFGALGAAFAVKRSALLAAGLFDPDFFMYFEETDLCWRLWLAGYRIVLAPRSIVYHKGASSTRTLSNVKAYLLCRNRVASIMKNYELKNVVRYLPVHLMILFSFALVKIGRRELAVGLSIARGVTEPILSPGNVIRKRRLVQSRRLVPDSMLIGHVIKSPSLTRFIETVSKRPP